MIRAVLIDIDDTLLDFDAYVKESMRKGFKAFSLPQYTDDMFDTFRKVNTMLWHKLEEGKLSFEELKKVRWALVLKELGIDFDGVAFEEYFRKELFFSAIPVEGAEEFLVYLHKRFPLYTASNGPYEQQRNRLKVAGFDRYFTDHFISEQIGFSKPSGEFFEHCFQTVRSKIPDVEPEEILMIGDSISSDVIGANSFGMKTCFFDKKMVGNNGQAPYDFYITCLDQIKLLFE